MTWAQIEGRGWPRAEVVEVEGAPVSFETVVKRTTQGQLLVVVQAFSQSWYWPNWLALGGVGHLYADGVLIDREGNVTNASDEALWEYR